MTTSSQDQDDINGIGVWLVWLCGGVFGVIILLLVICYCCLMPRHQNQKPHMEPCNHRESSKEIHWNMYHAPDIQIPRPPARPVSYAGHICHTNITPYYSEIPTYNMHQDRSQEHIVSHGYMNNTPTISEITAQYASSNMLDDMVSAGSEDSLKTRSLPAFLRSKQRPLSTEDDMYQLYAKVKFSKKRRNRMRNDDAAVIALSKSQSQCLNADAVIVYDERTAL